MPELKNLSKKYIHKPWEFNNENFKLGRDYPHPILSMKKQEQKL